ncbi:Glutathione transport system permease protein GsiD [Methylobacterium cerastii]|uniref:Glutathione transport system permease protein GsiD n=1 Tax=Methylobacterium cerastii TaxID=932741 RepID=A0ABQ4QLZ0_9HYPH|nr:ABC transporter permease [Methylobacterium cerastii]GJD46187.1 Glutathione transport system permease protein GsiD [Methylobacterium cerastii]
MSGIDRDGAALLPSPTVVEGRRVPLPREPGTLRAFWRRLRARRSAVVGLVIVVGLVLMAVFAAWIAPYDPTETDWGAVRAAPSLAHPFGGDEVGRDVLARIVYGARASLGAGLVSVALAVSLGLPLGLVAGYAGGWVDGAIMRLTDALLAIPFLILAIALAAFLGPSLTNAMVAIGLSATSTFVRLTRAQVQALAAEEFVEAARSVGNPPWRIALVHILPNIVPAILVQATLTIAAAIIAEASLSFLGLGQQPPEPSWGAMLNVAKNFLDQAPWMAIWPGLSIFLAVLGFNLFGDGLRDALDPRGRT